MACQKDTHLTITPFKVAQRSTVDVPGLSGQVKIWVGDIQRGTRAETVRIHTTTDETLYESAGVEEDTEMNFNYGGKQHTVIVKQYEDHTFSSDYAHLEAQVDNGFIAAPVQKKDSTPELPPKEGSVEKQNGEMKTQIRKPLETTEYKPPREANVCGTTQPSIQDRITHCATKNPELANLGPSDGHKHNWQLVTRTTSGREVWFNARTERLWSDQLGRELMDLTSWCRAAGSTETSTTRLMNCTPQKEPDGYDVFIAQSDPAESWCEAKDNFVTPTRFDDAKGQLSKTSAPSVLWNLPTEDDWKAAKQDQAADVLPNFNRMMSWSTSLLDYHATNIMEKYMAARGGNPNDIPRFPVKQVRCIGRLANGK